MARWVTIAYSSVKTHFHENALGVFDQPHRLVFDTSFTAADLWEVFENLMQRSDGCWKVCDVERIFSEWDFCFLD